MDGEDLPQAFRREDGLGWAGTDQSPIFHDNDFIGILPSLIHIVQDDDNRLLPVLIDAAALAAAAAQEPVV